MEPFGFEVKSDDADYWTVCLPHQCDRWGIAGEAESGHGVPHGEAVADLQRFIAEAQEALTALRQRQEFAPPREPALFTFAE